MNIALIGYGKMGRAIDEIISQSDIHQIVSRSFADKNGLDLEGIQKADVAIDFTSPEIVMDTMRQVIPLGIPLVVGTTGWQDHLSEVEGLVTEHKNGLIYGGNFSIGVNVFFNMVAYASKLLAQFDGYDVSGVETHHVHKKDSPSGTARQLADTIMKNYPSKTMLQTEKLDRQIKPEELHFASVRSGRNVGEHEITFDSAADEIRLAHKAWNRRGFAEGSLVAAEYIRHKKGMYNFADIFTELR